MVEFGVVWALAVFALVIYLLFKQPLLRIPFTTRYLHLEYSLAPLVGILLLLPASLLSPHEAWKAVIGTANIRPYSIVIMILGLSYLCYSLDQSGFFDYASLKLLGTAKSGKELFLLLTLWTFLLTLFTDNDIVILTLTFLICDFARRTSLPPKPLLLAQFFTVNTAGMVLYIGNPTNIILSNAAGVGFVEYSRWMLLPSLMLAAAGIGWLWILFGRKIKEFRRPGLEPSLALQNRRSAVFALAALVGAILLMSLGFTPWKVALLFALLTFGADLLLRPREVPKIVRKVPWKLSYFLLGLFILIAGVERSGALKPVSSLLALAERGPLGLGVLILTSALVAAVINNHPMSVLFGKSLGGAPLASLFACVVGSNLGANLSLVGALAGILWSHILLTKGVEVTFYEFSRWGFLYTLPLIFLMGFLLGWLAP